MNRIRVLAGVIILTLFVLTLTSCGHSEFGVTENSGKAMTITAKNADKDAFIMSGSLEVADGEQIEITSSLSKGMIRVEIVKAPENQSINEIPEMDDEAVITAELRTTDGASGTVPAGSYMVKAACLEKATGSIQLEVKPAA